jgi:hypothetical protein
VDPQAYNVELLLWFGCNKEEEEEKMFVIPELLEPVSGSLTLLN